ncbi:MAG TPA: proton-conducting transporter membrane subunit [Reyranella sp.]|jgi:formate hydrogenlyase subunit 3/multisubunit Na+/H+ antiporter MnhD subunit
MSVLLIGATLAPLLLLLVACSWRASRPAVLAWLPVAPLPALAVALPPLFGPPLSLALPSLRISLILDLPGAMLLGVSALLWSVAGIWAATFLRSNGFSLRFVGSWLLTLSGSVGVFMAADLLSFYLLFALASLPAYGLIAHDDDARGHRAGSVYMAFTILSEAFLLMGFVLLAAGDLTSSVQIGDVMAALPRSPWRDGAMAFTAAGFVLKVGLVPMHGWMPVAYAAAPIPAAAVLSGAGVKAGVIGFIRFLPFDAAMPLAGELLVALGLLSAFYGVVVGITQSNPPTVLAYSSVSQMGVIAATLGMGLASGDSGTALAGAFYAAHHVLAKGALFLAVGVIATSATERRRPTLILATLVALGLAGLPLTGGALAKLAIKEPLGEGLVGMLSILSAIGTTVLMVHFIVRIARTAEPSTSVAPGPDFLLPWRIIALAAIGVPWLLYPVGGGDLIGAFAPGALLDAAWPVAIGVVLALALIKWGDRLPRIAAGDVVVPMERAFHAGASLGAIVERLDGQLRQWPAATLSLVLIAVALTASVVLGR